MQKLTFKKDKIIASFWDTESEDWQDRSLSESNLPISWFLPYETYVDDGVTLRDILIQLEEHSTYLNLIFINYLKGIPFSDLINELKNIEQVETPHKIDAICLMWASEVKPPTDEDEESFIQIYSTLMGLTMAEDEDLEEDELFSIHEVTSTQLLDSEFVIDDIIEFYTDDKPEETILDGVTSWTLYDVLKSILNDLSTYSIVSGLFKRSEGSAEAPIQITELLEHLADLDKFFKSDQTSRK
jgi:hypothetical protein